MPDNENSKLIALRHRRHNSYVHLARRISRHPLTGQTIRYGISGATVMVVYLALPLLFSDVFGWPLQASIPIAYILAVSLQFTFQRKFVFRHVEEFALSVRAQLLWYVAVGAVQYPTTALGTLVLPKLLGVSDRVAFLATSLAFSLVFFLFIRGRVFHGAATLDVVPAESPSRAFR